jgi:hypothetical protein
MQLSIVRYKNIDLTNRIDAEYFEPSYLSIEQILKNKESKKLSSYCKTTGSAFYPAATHLYASGEIPFIRCVDCINYPAITPNQNDLFERLPKYFVKEHKNIKVLRNNDIVITKVGSPCFASIIDGFDKLALSRTVLGLRDIRNINPFYLTIFLRSRYGFQQLWRERELTIQYQLTLDRVGNVLIYKPQKKRLEDLIAQIFISHQSAKNLSVKFYSEAEGLLLNELGLADWRPEHSLSFVKNFSDTRQTERIDAEYFQPKYDEVERILSKKPQKTLEELCRLINYGTVPTSPYSNEGVPYIKGLNLINGFIDGNLDLLENTDKLPEKFFTKENDIIISQMGTVGKAGIVTKKEENYLFASFTIRVRLKNNDFINPYVLTLFINSVAREWYLLRRIAQASVRQNTDLPTIKKLKVPLIKDDVQNEIADKIKRHHQLKADSRRLLEIAKCGVEMAIEKDEKTAEEWIRSKQAEIGVET